MIERVTLAEMAAKCGKTEDELRAWIHDAPRRRAAFMDRIMQNPRVREYMAKHAYKSRPAPAGWDTLEKVR